MMQQKKPYEDLKYMHKGLNIPEENILYLNILNIFSFNKLQPLELHISFVERLSSEQIQNSKKKGILTEDAWITIYENKHFSFSSYSISKLRILIEQLGYQDFSIGGNLGLLAILSPVVPSSASFCPSRSPCFALLFSSALSPPFPLVGSLKSCSFLKNSATSPLGQGLVTRQVGMFSGCSVHTFKAKYYNFIL